MAKDEIELLRMLAQAEDGFAPDSLQAKIGWRCRDVRFSSGAISKLFMAGYVEDAYESNSYHGYRLTAKARALLAAGEASPKPETADATVDIPEGVFEDIIGHEEVKELCLLYTSPSPRDRTRSRMPSSA